MSLSMFQKVLSIGSLLEDDGVKQSPQTAEERMYMVPLEDIFGSSDNSMSTRYRRPIHQLSGATLSDSHSPSPRSFSVSTTYSLPTDEELSPIPVIMQTEVGCEQLDSSAILQFSIYYDVQRSVLNIHLLKATRLPFSSSSRKERGAFVRMCLASNKKQVFESSLVAKSYQVEFDESFDFHGVMNGRLHTETLIFQIYEGTTTSVVKSVGSVVLPLGEADLFGVITTMKIDETRTDLLSMVRSYHLNS